LSIAILSFLLIPPPPSSTRFPYTTLFRSTHAHQLGQLRGGHQHRHAVLGQAGQQTVDLRSRAHVDTTGGFVEQQQAGIAEQVAGDRKSTRLNSSHVSISYAVFCLKKKKIA